MDALHLEVGFSVERLGFDVANTFGLGGMDQHDVAGNELVLFDLNDVANPHLLPLLLLE